MFDSHIIVRYSKLPLVVNISKVASTYPGNIFINSKLFEIHTAMIYGECQIVCSIHKHLCGISIDHSWGMQSVCFEFIACGECFENNQFSKSCII